MNRLSDVGNASRLVPKVEEGDEMLRPLQRSGVKSKLFNREGLASVQDSGLYKRHLEDYKNAVGDGGYSIKLCDSNGTAITDNRPLNIGGRVFYPSANGVYTFIDEDALEEQKRLNDEVEQYVDSLVEYSSTDEALSTITRISVEKLAEICLKETTAEYEKIVGKRTFKLMPDDVKKADCLPSLLFLLHPHTREFALGVSKLRTLIKAVMPIIQKQGTKQTLKEEA